MWLVSELTPVSSVSVDYTCTTNSATVQWAAVLGAESYRAIAIGDNGTQLMCTSPGTSCQISGLDCGQSYVVHVTPVSESCTNLLNSTAATFQTGEKPLGPHCHSILVCVCFDEANSELPLLYFKQISSTSRLPKSEIFWSKTLISIVP